ncbi:MAG: response regulator [Planctomycetaceae bacterium]|jgi:signal transduction histidine kinase/ActR/RegA family two-component response regulator|nr:response regulator [Planctomycetaceae bacterium]
MNIPISSLFGLIFQWDIVAILLPAVLGMTVITVWLWRKQYRFTPLIGIWLLFLLILSIGIGQVYIQEPFCPVTEKDMLIDKTDSFAPATEISEYSEFAEMAAVRADQWNQMMRSIRWGALFSLILLLVLYLTAIYFIAALHHSVKRLTETNRELVNAKKSADAVAKVKKDFLVNMNHNIRTPMNAIIGFTDIFMQRALQSGYVEEWEGFKGILEIIQKSSSDLLTIINDFLDFSQIEANLLQIESIPMSVKQALDEIEKLEMPKATEKDLKFLIRYNEPIPELILGDPVRLRQVLLNLIDNAIKFTSKGKIEIHCESEMFRNHDSESPNKAHTIKLNGRQTYPEATILKISVLDTGIGISPEQMEYLFQPFAVDHYLTHEVGGTGLGLSIAKRLAQLMDGNITVKSEPNVGSVFTLMLHVYLPSKEESSTFTEKHRNKSDEDLCSESEPESDVSERGDAVASGEESEMLPQQPLKNVRILLVEDMLINQLVISTQLRNAGANVEIADNGELGIQKITQDTDNGLFFDVILMDMQMPVKDGYEATAQLRAQGYNRPIIAVTAHALTGDREKTIEAGCDDYISKPVERKVLIETVKKYLKSKRYTFHA